MKTEGLRAVTYLRISRDDGDTEGSAAIKRQREDCNALAALRRYNVVGEKVDDGVSAYGKKERRAWEEVLGMIERGEVDVVVAYHIDRLTRNMLDLEKLIVLCEKHNVGVVTVTGDIDLTTDTGRMVARIIAAVARAEVERKAARQKRANQQRREKGEGWKSGWRSFGYTLEFEVVPDEADLIRESVDELLTGASLRSISRKWADSGLSTPRSDKGAKGWTHQSVKAVLLNPKLAGYLTYEGEIVGDGNWEPILDRDTFALLHAKLTDPSRTSNGNTNVGRLPANLLSGIAICDTCEEGVVGRTASIQKQVKGKRETIGRKPVYSCPGYHISIDRPEADELVMEAFNVAAHTFLPGMVLSIPEPGQNLETVKAIEEEKGKLRELAASFGNGNLPLVVMEQASATIQRRIEALEATIQASTDDYDPRKLNREAIENAFSLELEGQRALLRRLASIRLYPKGRGRRGAVVGDLVGMSIKVTNQDGETKWVKLLDPNDPGIPLPSGLYRPSDLLLNVATKVNGE